MPPFSRDFDERSNRARAGIELAIADNSHTFSAHHSPESSTAQQAEAILMQLQPFELERWQSVWENKVELNISESGVFPLTIAELVADEDAIRSLLEVQLGYPQSNGSEELRTKIVDMYPGATMENVLVTCGGSEANFVCTWALIERGDEVVFMIPNYMQVAGVACAFGATIKHLWLQERLGWGIDPDDVAKLVTPKTKLIVVCNPNNPAGSILTDAAREAIIKAATRVDAWILADEVYRGAEMDGRETRTFWGSYDRLLCTAGLSKAYSLPGLRTGWVIGPPDMIDKLWGYHDYTSIGPTMMSDRLASIALDPYRRKWILNRTRRYLDRNYPTLRHWLDVNEESFAHIAPRAGAIAWARLREGWNSVQMAEELRAKKDVLIVPGEHLGMPSHVRFGFGGSPEHLHKALARISEWLAEKWDR
jgi:aspartate/methionine/tyrosine aminotransferase